VSVQPNIGDESGPSARIYADRYAYIADWLDEAGQELGWKSIIWELALLGGAIRCAQERHPDQYAVEACPSRGDTSTAVRMSGGTVHVGRDEAARYAVLPEPERGDETTTVG